MKKQIHDMKLNNTAWKSIKKNKKSIELRLNDEKRQKIKVGDIVIFTNQETGKQIKRKVKKLHPYPNFEELYAHFPKKKLGYAKKKEASFKDMEKYYSKKDIEKNGVLGIELKPKRRIILKILLSLLVIIGLYFLTISIRSAVMKANDKKINNAISELENERIDYVFIDINPSFALLFQGNKVANVACLNEDCMKIYNDINIIGKSMNDSIEHLYHLAEENGFDTSKGVRVRTTSNIKVENLVYVSIEYIDQQTQEALLSTVKNNEQIKENNNDNYYASLWEELKKDKDYGKLYDCNMNGKELECYFKNSAFPKINEDDINPANFIFIVNQIVQNQEAVTRVLNKFNIANEKDTEWLPTASLPAAFITIGGIQFEYNDNGMYVNYDLGDTDNYGDHDTAILSLIPNFNGEKGLNLLNPTEILNRLSFSKGLYTLNHYQNEGSKIFLQKHIICDKNKQNCTRDIFSQCNDQQATNCHYIDKNTYEQLKEEYNPSEIGREPNASGAGCETHDDFNPVDGICDVRDKDDENKKIAYYRCKNNSFYKKDCTPITKEIYDQYYKTRSMCFKENDSKFSCNFDNNAIGSSNLICDVDLNTFKISNCISYNAYYGYGN